MFICILNYIYVYVGAYAYRPMVYYAKGLYGIYPYFIHTPYALTLYTYPMRLRPKRNCACVRVYCYYRGMYMEVVSLCTGYYEYVYTAMCVRVRKHTYLYTSTYIIIITLYVYNSGTPTNEYIHA